ncbi:MAG: hydrolase [Deltaproteobacteria bacterium]|nr:hydrolase [Deltaproteobacteria bacterium]
MSRTAGLLERDDALVALIDVQANHFPTVADGPVVLDRLVRFVRAARLLEVPLVWTEHHPRAFGPTLPELRGELDGLEPIPKLSFGCFGEPRFAEAVERSGRGTLYLVGTETHICIGQTALAALARGLRVVLPVDCLGSRHPIDHATALRRLEQAGAVPSTWEAIVYEWMRDGRHPLFKRILPIVKGAG